MAVTMVLPSGLNAAELTVPALAADSTVSCWPVAAANTGALPSPQATTILLPSGLNDAVLGDGHASIERSRRSSRAAQTVTTPLSDAVTNSLPLLLNSMSLMDGPGVPSTRILCPVAASHTSTWPLISPVRIWRPLGLNATTEIA